jgi:nucleoside-diphosphate-sugar epimerase
MRIAIIGATGMLGRHTALAASRAGTRSSLCIEILAR